MAWVLPNGNKVRVITSAAAAVDCYASYGDLTTATGATTAGAQATAITTATTTDVVATPSSGVVRNVRSLFIRNKDATLAVDVTVLVDISGTQYQLFKCSLNSGDCLHYTEATGFFVISGASKYVGTLMLLSDATESAGSFASIPGMAWSVKANRHYVFEAQFFYQTTASTTGAQFGIDGPASPSLLIVGNIATVTGSVTAAAFSSGVATAYNTAITAQTTGPSTTNVPATISGAIIPSADGTVNLKFRTEVAASALTLKAGSWVEIRETDN